MAKSKFLLAAEAEIAERKRRETQMTDAELQSERDAKRHADNEALRERHCAGVDLVEKALSSPESLTEVQRVALLGQPADEGDQYTFLRSLKGFDPAWQYWRDFQWKTWSVDQVAHRSPELCKFTLCDWRVPEQQPEEDANAAVARLYAEQQRLEQEGGRLEAARARVRTSGELRSRHYAHLMLEEYEGAVGRGEELDPKVAGDRIKPKTPAWIRGICSSRKNYGFAIYKTLQARERPGAEAKWLEVFEDEERTDNLAGFRRARESVFDGDRLIRYMEPRWIDDFHPDEADPIGLRRHFNSTVAPTLADTRYLRNTFLVLSNDCLFPELDSREIEPREPHEVKRLVLAEQRVVPDSLLPNDVPTFFVWAYDAEWVPPEGQNADENGYAGRVKADIKVLFTWLYYARLDGKHDLKDLWRKAQRQPDQTWTCWSDDLDPTQPAGLV